MKITSKRVSTKSEWKDNNKKSMDRHLFLHMY